MVLASPFETNQGLTVKTCAECKEVKPKTDFYRHPKSGDGLLHICKACHRHRMKIRRLTNPYVQQHERDRAKLPERKRYLRENADKWRKENPAGYRAHNAVNNAIRDKKMAKEPCALCGTTENVHGHHKDYTRPLEVTWLCARCHQRLHSVFPELGANAQNPTRSSK